MAEETKTETQTEKIDKVVETLEPRVAKREQRVFYKDADSGAEFDRTYTQQKLAWFNKVEFTSVIGKGLDQIMEQNEGNGGIMEMLASGTTSMDSFLRIVFQIAGVAPDLLMELYMVALGVPRHERPIVEDVWRLPHNEEDGSGGLSDEDGEAIAKLIFEQNGPAIRDFFARTLPELIEVATASLKDPNATEETPKQG